MTVNVTVPPAAMVVALAVTVIAEVTVTVWVAVFPSSSSTMIVATPLC